MKTPHILGIAAALSLTALPIGRAEAGATLDQVRASKVLTCGINTDEADYSKSDTHGNMAAFGADICRAVAVAILGPDAVVKAEGYLDEQAGLAAVKAGKVAMLAGATPSLQNAGVHDVRFGPPVFYDGEGFLVSKQSGITTLADLAGKDICFIAESDADQALQSASKKRGIAYQPFPFEEIGEMQAAFLGGHCAAMAGDISALADARPLFHKQAGDFAILPETVSSDPLAPATRRDDPEFGAIVDWTIYALFQADESGVTGANIDRLKATEDRDIQGLVGGKRGLGQMLALDDDWAARVIKAVGNYGEIFDRDLGDQSPLKLPRGRNVGPSKGGLMQAMPIR